MPSDEYRVLYKEAGSETYDLWLFRLDGDTFHPVPDGLGANGSVEIADWRNLDPSKLSQMFAQKYGQWGGGPTGPWGAAPSVGPEEYRIRSVSPLVGGYYKKIYRPVWDGRGATNDSYAPLRMPFQDHALIRQIDRLTDRVMEAAEYIEPTSDTISTYSVALRETLILQCTEIETILQNLLIEHSQSLVKRNWSTKDYVKTADALRLREYKVNFSTFPRLIEEFTPFVNWDSNEPTQSLPFYDAYNTAKHNREEGLECATFHNVLLSYAALIIVAYATCGPVIVKDHRLPNFVFLTEPNWKIDDHYIPIFQGRGTQVDQKNAWSERSDFQFS